MAQPALAVVLQLRHTAGRYVRAKALKQLLEAGDLEEVAVQGWCQPAYLPAGSEIPARATPSALLSPFDPLVWERDRTERLFGFRYRLEFYTPAAKRQYGYFVMPYLHRGRLRARVDLKADRAADTLRVIAAHGEEKIPVGAVVDDLAQELIMLRDWIGLERFELPERGDLAAPLRQALRAS